MINKKTPNIGFSPLESELKKLSFEKIFVRVKSYSLSRSVESNSETGTKYIHYGDIHTKVADKVDRASNIPYIVPGDYETLQKGDLILADASEDYQGIATPAVIIDEIPFNIVAGLHTIALRPKKADSLYLYYLLKSSSFRKYGYRTGTGMKVFGISVTNVLKFDYLYPDIQEQQKIGEFFKQLDDRIALQQHQIKKLKQSKQGFLQKMFPKDGESVPGVRFDGFSEEWEIKKVDDIANETYGGGTPKTSVESYWKGTIPWLQSSDLRLDNFNVDIPTKYINEDSINNSAAKIIPANSIAVVTRVGVGKIALIPYIYATSQDFLSLSKLNVDINFALYSLYLNIIKVVNKLQGTSIKGITKSELLKRKILLPREIKEQQQIGEFFKQLDDLIAKNERELELLQETKKGFLQKMFV
ncbi:hypothetical protein HMI01_17570 [Halolactibacillus miurensis]|uniref:Type I restriction enzyme, S subunit n=1 Tax=Halolactibacillus miurensis TaxID=306541 RepID=A0A1I6NY73_9BACI|nr:MULTISPECIES: restriction endonuclease subunit S [Halolactibacillus]GEM04769.1 hypothetical protein HMI01_17570 [Halolactibacillus miurensis]SFS32825.1 type I restriction enzyme, S subunit [Halolactibacillus miurensis]